MLYTTLNEIREFSPCEDGWKQLLTYLNKTKADGEKLDFKTILEAVGIKDTLWCLRTQDFKDYYKFNVRVSYSVLPIYESNNPDDNRPRLAIEAFEKFINGDISEKELVEARAAAKDAVYSTYHAADADDDDVEAACARAAYHAAEDSYAAAYHAAYVTAYAAYHAADAAKDASMTADAAKKEKWEEIEKIFIEECLN